MSNVKSIRKHLGMTQSELAEAIGCSQGNVWQYERPPEPDKPTQQIPPERAIRLVEVAKAKGLDLSLDQVYGYKPLPFSTEAANEPDDKAAA